MKEDIDEKNVAKEAFVHLKDGDIDSFDIIYNLSKKGVYFAIYLILKDKTATEDLMQETYVSFLDNVSSLRADVDVLAYLVTIAKNNAINYYRRHKKENELLNNFVPYSFLEENFSDSGLIDLIKENLSEKEYTVFLLRVLGEYSFKEISKFTKIKIGTLTWLYQEARRKLEIKLGGK